jgi:hypothetical protein
MKRGLPTAVRLWMLVLTLHRRRAVWVLGESGQGADCGRATSLGVFDGSCNILCPIELWDFRFGEKK